MANEVDVKSKRYSPTYKVWESMRRRCTVDDVKNPRNMRYRSRGITVCERWLVFENFLADMGERPAGTTLDRIDNAKGYEPGNCRWATPTEQQRNRTNNVRLTIFGETLTAAEWAERGGIDRRTLHHRLRLGWRLEDAVTKPLRKTSMSRQPAAKAGGDR